MRIWLFVQERLVNMTGEWSLWPVKKPLWLDIVRWTAVVLIPRCKEPFNFSYPFYAIKVLQWKVWMQKSFHKWVECDRPGERSPKFRTFVHLDDHTQPTYKVLQQLQRQVFNLHVITAKHTINMTPDTVLINILFPWSVVLNVLF